jgi:hypothetical protein
MVKLHTDCRFVAREILAAHKKQYAWRYPDCVDTTAESSNSLLDKYRSAFVQQPAAQSRAD